MNILHPIKNLKVLVVKKFIEEALEELPNLKQMALLYIESHKDEFLDFIFLKIKAAIKDFITKKIDKEKEKIIKVTEN